MKTVKKVAIEPVFVEQIPETMEPNKVYITEQYGGCKHLCLCGCGVPVWLPLKPDFWTLTKHEDGKISLSPSILQRFDCKSHYILIQNVANFG